MSQSGLLTGVHQPSPLLNTFHYNQFVEIWHLSLRKINSSQSISCCSWQQLWVNPVLKCPPNLWENKSLSSQSLKISILNCTDNNQSCTLEQCVCFQNGCPFVRANLILLMNEPTTVFLWVTSLSQCQMASLSKPNTVQVNLQLILPIIKCNSFSALLAMFTWPNDTFEMKGKIVVIVISWYSTPSETWGWVFGSVQCQ